LVPVTLTRGSAHESFRVSFSEEDIIANITLREKLKEFSLQLPELEETGDLRPAEYFAEVRFAIAGEPRFEVLPDRIVLGLFSFSRLLMYRDLDPTNWPAGAELESQPLMRAVLADGFRDEPEGFPDNQPLDEVLSPLEAVHVLDADSSQTIAIEEVRRRRNLLIQGPPGTGKSQTIANIIASAVKDGKRILFVAEKMAALEVVHRRLNNLGLGDMCLEVHSHKANKRALLEGLKHTLELGPPCRPDPEGLGARLAETRACLNEHAAIMHSAIGQSGYTPFTAIGEMIRLVRKGFTHIDFDLAGASGWTARGRGAASSDRRAVSPDIPDGNTGRMRLARRASQRAAPTGSGQDHGTSNRSSEAPDRASRGCAGSRTGPRAPGARFDHHPGEAAAGDMPLSGLGTTGRRRRRAAQPNLA
jgi:hypothetical protein